MLRKIFQPKTAAIVAAIVSIPIAVIYFAVFLHVDWVNTMLKAVFTNNGEQPNALGFIFVFGGMFVLPFAFVLSLIPMLRRGVDGKRHLYLLNCIVAVLIAILMFQTLGGMVKDIYHCDILKIPNCD